jgi:exonuclease VII large subunit
MVDKETSKEDKTSLTSETKALKTVLFKYLQLHEELQRQSAELTQQSQRQTQQHTQLMQLWQQRLTELDSLEETLHQHTDNITISKLQRLCHDFEIQLKKELEKHLGQYADRFTNQTHHLAEQVRLAKQVLSSEYLYERIITMGMTLVCSLFISWLIMPHPTLPLTDEQLADYYLGHNIRENIRKLSPSTRQEIQKQTHVQLPKPKPYRYPGVQPSIQEMLGEQ